MCPKGRRRVAEREVSRGRISRGAEAAVKGRTRGRAEPALNLGGAGRQMSMQMELPLGMAGETRQEGRSGEALTARGGDERSGHDHLMEKVVERGNIEKAMRRVRQNKGSPGADGMTVDELPRHMAEGWEGIRARLLGGTYWPKPVLRRGIPKEGGGIRELGIPCVLDRLIQQGILQVLQPIFDPGFSEHSHGFRPGRGAHRAVREAQGYIQEGCRWVVDIDLEKFFDRVNHDVLMGRLAGRISDKRLLGLIRRYLEAGIMADGVVMQRQEGTPQGGPLSPLLANILLDEVDKELERRGHRFVRYADDCNVYVRTRRAGERVKEALARQYAKLKLRVNEAKSAVDRPHRRTFLGFSFWYSRRGVQRKVSRKALGMMKRRVRLITRRNGGRSLAAVAEELRRYLTGWGEYFKLADTPRIFRSLDEWIRHRMRAIQLKHWRRGTTVFRALRARGWSVRDAATAATATRHMWRGARDELNCVLPSSDFDRLGVPRLSCLVSS